MVEKIASLLEASLKERVVHFILRQRAQDPKDVVILCTTPAKSERLEKKLSEELGYDHGPPPSNDLIVHEGTKMSIQFRGNIQKDEEESAGNDLHFVFNSHIRTRQEFVVHEVDRFAQKSINCYRGFAQICTGGLVEKTVPLDEEKAKQNKSTPTKTILVQGKDINSHAFWV